MKYRKGVSPVIASVLVVLLTITIGGIIAAIVISFTQDNLNESKECFSYLNYFTFDESLGYSCYDGTKNSISVKSLAGDEDLIENIDGFVLNFIKGPISEPINVKLNDPAPANLELVGALYMCHDSTAQITIPQKGEIITYVYFGDKKYDKVEIYPLLKSGKICETKNTIDLIQCVGGLNCNVQ